MSSSQDSPLQRTLKAKKPTANAPPPPPISAAWCGPTTFFLRSEKEVEKSVQRGRKTSRDTVVPGDEDIQATPMMADSMDSSAFGVQSLEDTMLTSGKDSLSRTNSNISEASVDAGAEANLLAGRKRKAGNPVHPKIIATGQRILSAEQHTIPPASSGSPMSHRSADSPFRATHIRRNSASSSSINLSQPLTPLKMSPRPESAMPSTPRSASPKSFRLSDEEQSIASDAGSQAIVSSSGDENEEDTDDKSSAMPQLVMPSISMPTRRPFTERGKLMGRLKIMVVGACGLGKTSLIQSICRVCEDVVHLDSLSGSTETFLASPAACLEDGQVVEIGASTRPYPAWWTDFESRRMLYERRSTGEGVLERNLTFVDTPGLGGADNTHKILRHFDASLSRTAVMERMNDVELINLLSGEGGVQIDAVLYLFDPAGIANEPSPEIEMDHNEARLLRYLCKWTNVIPLIARADTVSAEDLAAKKKQLLNMLRNGDFDVCLSQALDSAEEVQDPEASSNTPTEPYAVSSALGSDPETIDASILMSSSYLQPLVSSDLDLFVTQLLEPNNTARLRHLAATKFLFWRQQNLGTHISIGPNFTRQQAPRRPSKGQEPLASPLITDTGSLLDEPSKVLVPHGSSSYFRSVSPSSVAASESSASAGAPFITSTSAQALARYNDHQATNTSSIPFRQVRLAKWAQDLQRSLDNERRRYRRMFASTPSSDLVAPLSPTNNSADSEKAAADAPNTSFISLPQHTQQRERPAKGRLGGPPGIIDPRDPLGLLAFTQSFRRRGWFALQIATSAGVLGALGWWVARNWWGEVVEFFGYWDWGWGVGDGQAGAPGAGARAMTAVPPPATSQGVERGWLGDAGWRNLVGLER